MKVKAGQEMEQNRGAAAAAGLSGLQVKPFVYNLLVGDDAL